MAYCAAVLLQPRGGCAPPDVRLLWLLLLLLLLLLCGAVAAAAPVTMVCLCAKGWLCYCRARAAHCCTRSL